MINIKTEEFEQIVYEKSDKDYGICPPPINSQEGLNILIDHFVGVDWYTSLPLGQNQVNTEAIYEILRKYPKCKTLKERLRDLLKHHKTRF